MNEVVISFIVLLGAIIVTLTVSTVSVYIIDLIKEFFKKRSNSHDTRNI